MTNAWVSSPSPSLGTASSELLSPSSALLTGWHIVLTLPRRLWDAYVTYLWHYQPESWVGRVASTFRILAMVLVLPVILLTLLDVTSYVIARTLGVDDDVKASTSDTNIIAVQGRMEVAGAVPISVRGPTMFMSEGPVRGSEGLAAEDSVEGRTDEDGEGDGCGCGDGRVPGRVARAMSATMPAQTRGQDPMEMETKLQTSQVLQQAYYFSGEEGSGLAGEGVFSPAASEPPSPLTPRMPLYTFSESDGKESGQVSEEGIVLRRRVPGAREEKLVHT